DPERAEHLEHEADRGDRPAGNRQGQRDAFLREGPGRGRFHARGGGGALKTRQPSAVSRKPRPTGSRGQAPANGSRFTAPGSGFTVVELAVVAAMIAILAAMAVPVARYTVKRQDELELRYALRQMRDAIDKYKQFSDLGLIPIKIGSEGYPPDMKTLV